MMRKKKKKEPEPLPECSNCFFSKFHSNQDVWCMRHPKQIVTYKVHWCGEHLGKQVAIDLDMVRGG